MRTPLPPTPASSPVIWSPPWTALHRRAGRGYCGRLAQGRPRHPGGTVLPAGRGEYTAVLTRRAITVPATYTELWDGHIGYIDCDTFGGETVAHSSAAWRTPPPELTTDRRSRGNGGGEVDAAMGAAGCFTGSGVLAYLKDSTGAYGAYGSNDDAWPLPVIVLTDGETASASELFASDIRDTNTGILWWAGAPSAREWPRRFWTNAPCPTTSPTGTPSRSPVTASTPLRLHHRHRWPDPHLLVDPDLAPRSPPFSPPPAPRGSTEGYRVSTLTGAGMWSWTPP